MSKTQKGQTQIFWSVENKTIVNKIKGKTSNTTLKTKADVLRTLQQARTEEIVSGVQA